MKLSCKASFNTALGSTYCSLGDPFLELQWYTKPGYLHPWLWVQCFQGFKDVHLHTSKGITQLSPLITAIKLTSISFQIISTTWQLSICQTVQLSHWEAAYQRKNDAGALKQHAADKTCITHHSSRNLLLSGWTVPFLPLGDISGSLGEKTVNRKLRKWSWRSKRGFACSLTFHFSLDVQSGLKIQIHRLQCSMYMAIVLIHH